jgi:tetratricopeptide (TPR) repeat protein
MQNSTQKDYSQATFAIALLAFLALHCIAPLNGDSRFWGVDQWRYLPRPVTGVLVVFGLLVLIPRCRLFLVDLAVKVSSRVPARAPRAGKLMGLVALGVSGVLFWRFRCATQFLGDGFLWASHLPKNVSSREPVCSRLYHLVYRLVNTSWLHHPVTPVTTAAMISVASGLVFLVFAYKTVCLVTEEKKSRAFVLLALLSSGMMLLFFGYVEAYPPFAAAVMAFTYYGIAYVMRKRGTLAVSLAFAVTVLLHLSAIALIPSFVLIFWMRNDRTLPRKKLRGVFFLAAFVGLAALWGLQRGNLFPGFFRRTFLPLFRVPFSQGIAYPLFSWANLFDSLNELLLICPIIVFSPLVLLRSSKEPPGEDDKVRAFLGAMAAFYLLEFLVFNRTIGASRDWDIFAPLAIPIALLTAIALLERFRRLPEMLTVFALALVVVHTAPWIGLNASRVRSEARFIGLVQSGRWSDYAKGYGYSTLGVYFERTGRMREAIDFSMEATRVDPGNRRYLYNAAKLYQDDKQYPAAARLYQSLIDVDPDNLDARGNLGTMFWDAGKLDLAEREFSEAVRRDSTYMTCYEPLSYIYFERGDVGRSLALYKTARRLGHDMTPFFRDLGGSFQSTGRDGSSKQLLEGMISIDPADPELYHLLGRLYLERKDYRRAVTSLNEAVQRYPNDPAIHVDLARAHYGLRDYARAWKEVRAAQSLSGSIPEDFLRELRNAMAPPA